MTQKHDAAAEARTRLEDLARLWLHEEWTDALTRELWASFPPDLDEEHAWRTFEDLAEAIRLRDGVNEGRIHWREVCPALTGPNYSLDAYEIACGLVDDALELLLHGRPC